MLSAAALRKRLLEKQASVSAAESSDNSGAASPDSGPASPSVNGGIMKAKAAKGTLKKEASRTTEEVLLGDSGTVDETALYETTEAMDEPPRKRIQLSSISANSSSIQQKADGTTVLKVTDNSEVLPLLCLVLPSLSY